jgi:hypothetical protein
MAKKPKVDMMSFNEFVRKVINTNRTLQDNTTMHCSEPSEARQIIFKDVYYGHHAEEVANMFYHKPRNNSIEDGKPVFDGAKLLLFVSGSQLNTERSDDFFQKLRYRLVEFGVDNLLSIYSKAKDDSDLNFDIAPKTSGGAFYDEFNTAFTENYFDNIRKNSLLRIVNPNFLIHNGTIFKSFRKVSNNNPKAEVASINFDDLVKETMSPEQIEYSDELVRKMKVKDSKQRKIKGR